MYKCMTGSSLWWWSSLCHGLDIVNFDTNLGHRKVFPKHPGLAEIFAPDGVSGSDIIENFRQ